MWDCNYKFSDHISLYRNFKHRYFNTFPNILAISRRVVSHTRRLPILPAWPLLYCTVKMVIHLYTPGVWYFLPGTPEQTGRLLHIPTTSTSKNKLLPSSEPPSRVVRHLRVAPLPLQTRDNVDCVYIYTLKSWIRAGTTSYSFKHRCNCYSILLREPISHLTIASSHEFTFKTWPFSSRFFCLYRISFIFNSTSEITLTLN